MTFKASLMVLHYFRSVSNDLFDFWSFSHDFIWYVGAFVLIFIAFENILQPSGYPLDYIVGAFVLLFIVFQSILQSSGYPLDYMLDAFVLIFIAF